MKKGFTLIAAVFILLLMVVLAMVTATFISSDVYLTVKNYHSLRAFYIANAGMEYYRLQLKSDSDWTSPPTREAKLFSGGMFAISTTNEAKRQITIISTGTVTADGKTYTRILQQIARKKFTIGQFVDYGLYAGTGSVGGNLKFQNDSKIIGSFYYFGPIEIPGIRTITNPCQTDGVIYSTSISPDPSAGIPDYYAAWEMAGPATPPIWDDSYYTYWLNQANQPGGLPDPNLKTNQDLSLNGGTVYYKAFTMIDYSTLTGPGTLCVTGVGGNGRFIARDHAQIIGDVKIVARGTAPSAVDISGHVSFSTRAEIIALGQIVIGGNIGDNIVIPPESTLYSQSSGNAVNGNQTCLLQGSILAPFGTVTMNNYAWIKGLTFANNLQMSNNAILQGGAVTAGAGIFHDATKVIQDETVLPSDYPLGLSAEATVEVDALSNWNELY